MDALSRTLPFQDGAPPSFREKNEKPQPSKTPPLDSARAIAILDRKLDAQRDVVPGQYGLMSSQSTLIKGLRYKDVDGPRPLAQGSVLVIRTNQIRDRLQNR